MGPPSLSAAGRFHLGSRQEEALGLRIECHRLCAFLGLDVTDRFISAGTLLANHRNSSVSIGSKDQLVVGVKSDRVNTVTDG